MKQFEVLFEKRKFSLRSSKVCVIIRNYNYGHFIEECLDSLYGQDLLKFQLVIVDDFSKDDSLPIITRFLSRYHKRFQYVALLRTLANYGPVLARNIAIKHRKSEYYFMLDSDNILYPKCLSNLLATLQTSNAELDTRFAPSLVMLRNV